MSVVDPHAAAYEAWLATPEGAAAVNAQNATPAVPAAPEAPAAVLGEAAPVPAAPAPPGIDYKALAAAIAEHQATAAPAAPVAATTAPTSPVNLFTKGSIVEHAYEDPYDGPTSKVGVVLDVLPDEGSGAQSIIGWFGSVSSPIGDHLLTAV